MTRTLTVLLAAVLGCGGTTVVDEGTSGSGGNGGDGGSTTTTSSTGGAGAGGPTLCGEAPENVVGLYFLTVTVPQSPSKPLAFELDLSILEQNGDFIGQATAQPLNADDRVTEVGPSLPLDPFPIQSDGSFSLDWDTVTLPGEANPLTASVLEVELTQTGTLCPTACGAIDGMVLSPVMLNIFGSTFFMEMGSATDHTEPPFLNCDGDQANPL